MLCSWPFERPRVRREKDPIYGKGGGREMVLFLGVEAFVYSSIFPVVIGVLKHLMAGYVRCEK